MTEKSGLGFNKENKTPKPQNPKTPKPHMNNKKLQ